ncbi:MAG: DUF721 domain-containing protein [Acidobacteriota bacterium]|nr:DUF721 domain-containing protein [Acidobacteriota bacterium]
MEDLFRALPKLLKEMSDSEEVREAVVFAAWRRIAGESLQSHAVAFRLFNKHLIVAVASKTWKKHLEFLSGQMIFKINSMLGQAAVTFIEFRIDEETVLQERAKTKTSTISDEELKEIALDEVTPKLRSSADAIKDDNLRYQFLLAAGSALARKKKINKKLKTENGK